MKEITLARMPVLLELVEPIYRAGGGIEAMLGVTETGAFARVADQFRFDAALAQRGEHLLGLCDVHVVIVFTVQEHGWRGGILDVRERRPFPKQRVIVVGPWEAVELGVNQILIERGGVEADQVADAGRGNRGLEASGLRYDPVGHESAVAAAGNVEMIAIDVGVGGEYVIDAGHQVLVIAAAPVVDASVGEFLAVAGAAARIDREHGVAASGVELRLWIEGVPELAMRAAVDGEDH